MSVQLSNRHVNDIVIMDFSGRITLGEGASLLRGTLRSMANNGTKKILLNLAEVSYIDSSGLGVLVESYATITSRGGQLKLLNLQNRIQDLLVITKLFTVLQVFSDEALAIASFAEPVAQAATS
jgi:anti-sigma B factor antagonist